MAAWTSGVRAHGFVCVNTVITNAPPYSPLAVVWKAFDHNILSPHGAIKVKFNMTVSKCHASNVILFVFMP